MTRLGDLIVGAPVSRAGDREYPLLSMTMHHGLVDQSTKFKKRIASDDTSSYKVVRRGQLVVGFPIDEGVLDFQSRHDAAIVSPAYGIWDLCEEDRVYRPYLQRFLRSPVALAYYSSKLRSTTARRRSLPQESFLALDVPLPAFKEQRRIAAILDQADALRAKHRELGEHLERLPQAIFLDMFGDPKEADSFVPFGRIASLNGGRNLVAQDANRASPYRVLKISAVTTGVFRQDESKPLPVEYQPPHSHLVRPGDLLMSRANTSELVGAVAHVVDVRPNMALPDKIWRFNWHDKRSVPIFYHALFQSATVRRWIGQLASGTGGSMKNISKAKLESLSIPAVAFERQQEFADRVAVVPVAHDVAADRLFRSLQSQAFRGEL